jgi:hypothetical protein
VKQVEITCPNCGAIHTVELHEINAFYLDGMHDLSVSNFVKAMALCNCGLLCVAGTTPEVNPVIKMKSSGYQKALRASYNSTVEQKLALFDALYYLQGKPLYYAHYYDEIGENVKRQQVLLEAINNIINGLDVASYVITDVNMLSSETEKDLILFPELRLIDMYRCTGQFDEALQQIQTIRKQYGKNFATKYLNTEERLIKKKNSAFM